MAHKVNWNPSRKTIRQFGWTVFIGFAVIGALVFWKGRHPLAMGMWGGAAFVLALSLLVPAAAKPLYVVWMGLGMVMGAIMSRVVLTTIFFLVVTPVAFVFRMVGRDALRKKKPAKDTYWLEHPEISDAKYYEHLF